jgi:competence protein ComFC
MFKFSNILKFIYPSRCACCGRLVDTNDLCSECEALLNDCFVEVDACKKCGLSKTACECKVYNHLYSGICVPFYNKDKAQEMVYGFKYNNRPYAAKFLAKTMATRFQDVFKNVKPDLVCFVPSFKKDLKERSYDYVYLLAKAVADCLCLPLEKKLLIKTKHNDRQHKLKIQERQANVRNAYRVVNRIDGKTVLLIDDIKTTGYTLSECAKQLRLMGAEKVYCLTAVITANKTCKTNQNKI